MDTLINVCIFHWFLGKGDIGNSQYNAFHSNFRRFKLIIWNKSPSLLPRLNHSALNTQTIIYLPFVVFLQTCVSHKSDFWATWHSSNQPEIRTACVKDFNFVTLLEKFVSSLLWVEVFNDGVKFECEDFFNSRQAWAFSRRFFFGSKRVFIRC